MAWTKEPSSLLGLGGLEGWPGPAFLLCVCALGRPPVNQPSPLCPDLYWFAQELYRLLFYHDLAREACLMQSLALTSWTLYSMKSQWGISRLKKWTFVELGGVVRPVRPPPGYGPATSKDKAWMYVYIEQGAVISRSLPHHLFPD